MCYKDYSGTKQGTTMSSICNFIVAGPSRVKNSFPAVAMEPLGISWTVTMPLIPRVVAHVFRASRFELTEASFHV